MPKPSEPVYATGSVDRALRLLQMLRDRGEVRLRQAALELGVAESTVHRLLAMLIYHGFAVQNASRVYRPGPALDLGPIRVSWSTELIDIVAPHMQLLCGRTGETINLMIRVGTKIRFLWSETGDSVLRIVPRQGLAMPARYTAGGKVLLADLSEAQLRRLYQGDSATIDNEHMDEPEFQDLLRELEACRRSGHVVVTEGTEIGVTALGFPLRDRDGRAVAAIGVAVPLTRSGFLHDPKTLRLAHAMQREAEMDLRVSNVRLSGHA